MKRVYLYNGKPVCIGFEDECEAELLETFNGFALFPKSEQHAISLGFFTKEYADEYNFFTK